MDDPVNEPATTPVVSSGSSLVGRGSDPAAHQLDNDDIPQRWEHLHHTQNPPTALPGGPVTPDDVSSPSAPHGPAATIPDVNDDGNVDGPEPFERFMDPPTDPIIEPATSAAPPPTPAAPTPPPSPDPDLGEDDTLDLTARTSYFHNAPAGSPTNELAIPAAPPAPPGPGPGTASASADLGNGGALESTGYRSNIHQPPTASATDKLSPASPSLSPAPGRDLVTAIHDRHNVSTPGWFGYFKSARTYFDPEIVGGDELTTTVSWTRVVCRRDRRTSPPS